MSRNGWTLAVDFGTCFSSVAIWDGEGRPEVVVVAQQARFPSAVVLKDPATGELAVGRSATNAAVLHPDRVLRTPKRHLGVLEVALLGGTPVKVIDAVATVLDRVVGEARRQRGGTEPARVVMTHPARWGPERLGALGEAAAAVGLREPEFVSEPVAATFALPQAAVPVGGHVAVYDLGGGTFDTAVLRRAGEGFVVAGPVGGDEHFGGEDLDRRLFAHLGGLLSEVEPDLWTALEDPGEDLRWKRARAELYDGAREAKEALTDETAVEVHVREADRSLSVTRAEFERLVAPDLEATVALLADTVAAASLGPKDLAAIYLVGGAGQIPLISRLLHAHFGIAPTIYGDPKNTIVLGAALHQARPPETVVSVSPTVIRGLASRVGPALRQFDADQRRKAEQERRRKAAEEKRRAAEEDRKRRAAEAERKRKAAAETARKAKAKEDRTREANLERMSRHPVWGSVEVPIRLWLQGEIRGDEGFVAMAKGAGRDTFVSLTRCVTIVLTSRRILAAYWSVVGSHKFVSAPHTALININHNAASDHLSFTYAGRPYGFERLVGDEARSFFRYMQAQR